MIKIGMIGCGAWGKRYLPILHVTKDCDLVSCYRPSSQSISTLLSLFPNVRVEDDAELVIKNSDVVMILTPPEFRIEYIEMCNHYGKNFMVEKPISFSYSQYKDKILPLKVDFLVNHIHLFSGAYEFLRESFLQNYVGQDIRITSRGGSVGPFRNYSALWDYGPHDVSMTAALGVPFRGVSFSFLSKNSLDEAHFVCIDVHRGYHSFAVWNSHGPKQRLYSITMGGWKGCYDDTKSDKLKINGIYINAFDKTPPLQRSIKNFLDYHRTGVRDWRWDRRITGNVLWCLDRAGELI